MVALRSRRQKGIQRALAFALLLLMASDLGFHLVDPFFHSYRDSAETVLCDAHRASEPMGGCGIPGHEGTPFHHHHFPTLVSQTASPAPVITLAGNVAAPSVDAVQAAPIAPTGRAPPVS
jgi:hypothetical protein